MHGSISKIINRAYRAAQYEGLGYSAFPETDYVSKEFKRTMLGGESYSKILKKAKEINDPAILDYNEYEMEFFGKMESEEHDYTEHKIAAERNGIEIKKRLEYKIFTIRHNKVE